MEAIYDAKIMRIAKNMPFYSLRGRRIKRHMVDTQVKIVRMDYMHRVERLDLKCADNNYTQALDYYYQGCNIYCNISIVIRSS